MDESIIRLDEAEVKSVLDQLSFLSSMKVNDQYLVPAMRKIGTYVKKIEKPKVKTFTGSTQKSLTSKITTNGIGSVTATIGPNKKRAYIFGFMTGGAQWDGDYSASLRNIGGKKASQKRRNRFDRNQAGYKPNPSYLPANRLINWVKQELGASDNEALHIAFKVAKSIGRKGLKGSPIAQPTAEEARETVVRTLNETISNMVQELKNAK